MVFKEKKYCCFCGKELVFKTLFDGSEEKYCANCDHVFFNAPSPAVIVVVTNANKVLLTRAVEWSHSYWGLISGHIKVGETAEEAAVREVSEEVGLKVTNPEVLKTYAMKDRDFLMIAFRANAETTLIKKSQELKDARWFDVREPLPMRPTSIAAQVVQHVFALVTFQDVKDLETT
jgi:NAD+ diphosphatase